MRPFWENNYGKSATHEDRGALNKGSYRTGPSFLERRLGDPFRKAEPSVLSGSVRKPTRASRVYRGMATFFTHIATTSGLIVDQEGQQFVTLDDACAATEKSARHLVADAFRNGKDQIVLEFRIDDQNGVRLATVPVDAEIKVYCCNIR